MVPVRGRVVGSYSTISPGGRHEPLTKLEARPDARPALEAWIREYGTLEAAAARQPGVETLTGRGRVFVVPAPEPLSVATPASDSSPDPDPERWVVRHYHRGGAIASILGDRYLRVGTPRPVREYNTGRALERRGIPTPVHIGAAVYPSGIWYRGDLVTRYVPGSRDLAAVLFPGRSLGGGESGDGLSAGSVAGRVGGSGTGDSEEAGAALRAAGRLFRRLHEGGVVHPDLNLKNILLAGPAFEPDALVLDLDGATVTRRVSGAARTRMVARFWRSARKWEKTTGLELDPSLRTAFEAGYGTGSGDGPGASDASGSRGGPEPGGGPGPGAGPGPG